MKCPAWFALTRGQERTTNAAADRGTRIHDLAARVLKGLPRTPEIDEELGETGVAYVEAMDWGHYAECKVEELLMSPDPSLELLVYGTPDVRVSKGGERHIFDLKTGREYVSPVQNEQLSIYAWMAWGERECTLHIVQDAEDREWNASAGYMSVFRQSMKTMILANLQGGKPCPGEHCKWCKGKHQCSVWQEEHTALAIKSGEVADLTMITGDDLAKILDKADQVKAFIKACEAEALARGGAGDYVVVRGMSDRNWSEDLIDAKQELINLGVKPYEEKMIGLGEAEKRIRAVKKCTVKQAKEIVDRLTVRAAGSLKLVKQQTIQQTVTFTDEEAANG
jgi:hypothetical protein